MAMYLVGADSADPFFYHSSDLKTPANRPDLKTYINITDRLQPGGGRSIEGQGVGIGEAYPGPAFGGPGVSLVFLPGDLVLIEAAGAYGTDQARVSATASLTIKSDKTITFTVKDSKGAVLLEGTDFQYDSMAEYWDAGASGPMMAGQVG